jgi:serine/threonine-protein kinase
VLAVLVVGGGAGAVALGLGRGAPPAPSALPAPLPTSVRATPSTAPTPPAPSSLAPSPAPSAAPTGDPADLLRQQLDADAATVESLVGKWIPQLSSKREGDVVNGTRIDATAVLVDFRSWQAKVPNSVLTKSERFTSFRGRNYYVTLAAQPFDTPEAANAWCVTQGLAPDDCFAKRLSHTEGPSGNTRPR